MSRRSASAAQQKTKVHYPPVPLLLIFFAIGVGGIANFLNLYYNIPMPLAVAYSTAILGAVGGVSLSLFVIYLLRGAKLQSEVLLEALEKSGGARLRSAAEEDVGSSRTLALSGQSVSGTAIAATLAMAATSIIHIKTGEGRFLPMPWLAAQSTLSSFANLIGFVLSTLAGVRNAELLSRKHQQELDVKIDYIGRLRAQLERAGMEPEPEKTVTEVSAINPVAEGAIASPATTSASAAAGGGLFSIIASDVRRRSSVVGAAQASEVELTPATTPHH